MFDIAPSELLLTVVVAVVVIGPKDLPRALRLAGSWMGKIRRVSGHFKAGVEEMIRQAELQEMEQKWREQNAAILQEHPAVGEIASALPALPAAEPARQSADQHRPERAEPAEAPAEHPGPAQ